MNKRVLVTGGAGYIGSFMVKLLESKGFEPVVLDNLSNGYRESVEGNIFYEGDIGDVELVEKILKENSIDTVLHFAAFSSVKESMERPEIYCENNFTKSSRFFDTCCRSGVKKIIYSSTCSVYGEPEKLPITEETSVNPINPYGESKKKSEEYLRTLCEKENIRAVALRYFNVVGAALDGNLGERNSRNGRLFKIIAEACTGMREGVKIFGTDYDTEDGTAIRDYIHVEDLVSAHFEVLNYLDDNRGFNIFNVAYGFGYSVKEIVDRFIKRYENLNCEVADRRPGDPPVLIADNSKIMKYTDWKPQYMDIELIIDTTLKWEKNLMEKR